MNRHAIIISASYGDPNIPNVDHDAYLWYRHLHSELGGAWEDGEEITHLDDPTKQEVIEAVESINHVDFAFIVFIGHGTEIPSELPWENTQTALCLKDDDYLTKREINPATPWCTMVLDCCRGIERPMGFSKKGGADPLVESTRRVYIKQAFMDALAASEKGLTVLYAASLGQNAADKQSFSYCITYAMEKWSSKWRGVLPQNDSVTLAAEVMHVNNPQQTPEYVGGRRRTHLPIALNL